MMMMMMVVSKVNKLNVSESWRKQKNSIFPSVFGLHPHSGEILLT